MADPSLKNVCYIRNGKCVRITAEEAQREFRRTVSYTEEIFKCQLCNQYVTLTAEGINKSYFKHAPNNPDSRNCPEYQQGSYNGEYASSSSDYTYNNGEYSSCSNNYTFNPREYYLPIRIKIDPAVTDFELEIGMPPLPISDFFKNSQMRIVISASYYNNKDNKEWKYNKIISHKERNDFNKNNVYEYLDWHLHESGLTYFSIGKIPERIYSIWIFPEEHPYNRITPRNISGIKNIAIFNKKTLKRIPENTSIFTNYDYIIISHTRLPIQNFCRVNREFEAKTSKWIVYDITITKNDDSVWNFFNGLGGYELNEKIAIYDLWPVAVKTPYLLLHLPRENWFCINGKVGVELYPNLETNKYDVKESFYVISCIPNVGNQLVAIGRKQVLKYTYLWQNDLNMEGASPICTVKTINGQDIIQCGENNSLPEKKALTVSIDVKGHKVDGFYEIRRNGVIRARGVIKPDKRNDIEGIDFGDCVQIYAGLDKIWECSFVRKHSEKYIDDEALYQKLIRCRGAIVDIPHAIGALADKLKDYPKTRQWLRHCVQDGKMKKQALLMLQDITHRGLKWGII